MFLCEEYIQRHKIEIDLIKHINWGSLFFQTELNHWKILTVSWKDSSNYPGNYAFKILYPLKNGYGRDIFFEIHDEYFVYLDEYERFVYDVTNKVIRCPRDKIEVVNAAWEMSLYIFDSLIAKQASSHICNSLLSGNFEEFDEFTEWLSDKVPEFGKFWYEEMDQYVDSHLNWLGCLIHKRNATSNKN